MVTVRRAAVVVAAVAAALALTVFPERAGAQEDAPDDAPNPIAAAAGDVAVLPTGVINATGPTVSNDGRWVVFGGTLGPDDTDTAGAASASGRRSVFRADLLTGSVTEMSPLPEGARPGDTILPRLSANGCVIVAITQVAYDLFRDDDRNERWDVYRLLVPECDGQPNAWELVSTDITGVARDDVFVDAPPAVSGSGAVIAYTHQSDAVLSRLSTISVVDVTQPVDDPTRLQEARGVPIEAPNRAYRYRGAYQPVLSQNGRHLAFTSDALAADPLPGWGPGVSRGGWATTQVYVWDRLAAEQTRSVHLVSGRGGQPARLGAHSPAMSEDGRVVAFVSPDRELITSVLPRCGAECPTQIFRFDRDTDGNGRFDEPSRVPDLALVSAVRKAPATGGIPEGGNAASWAPAVNADGSSIAFVTDATNLMPSSRPGGGTSRDGDLLVAEFHLGELRRVLADESLVTLPGAHGNPVLNDTGSVVVFDTRAGTSLGRLIADGAEPPLVRGRAIAVARVAPQLAMAALDFGTVLLAFDSAELFANVQNAGPAAFKPGEVVVDSSIFRVTGGTCTRGIIVAAGASCSVKLVFNPTQTRHYQSRLTVRGSGADPASVSTELYGAAGDPTLLATPGGVDLPSGRVGEPAGRVAISIENTGFAPVAITDVGLGGNHPDDFTVLSEACTGRALNPGATCAVEVEFVPHAPGYRSALLAVGATTGQYTAAVLGGYARYAPVFEVAAPEVVAGTRLGVGGNGFPAGTQVRIGFADGSAALGQVTVRDDGGFIALLDVPSLVRSGQRRLVATGTDGAVAGADVLVRSAAPTVLPRTPGAGLG
ncbi:MAG TPA: choice-of-anchor D domain-containing protein [Ilumatobacter sp.]|nr:choice-of-anchor D domain-containing protein [Ilumatobacter sp.]